MSGIIYNISADFQEAELAFQAQKIPLMHKMVACLERIAYNTLPYHAVEFKDFVNNDLYKTAALIALEELKDAITGSEVQVQKGHEDAPSVRPRKSSGSKKHEDRSNTHAAGVSTGPDEHEEVKVRMANKELLEACGD